MLSEKTSGSLLFIYQGNFRKLCKIPEIRCSPRKPLAASYLYIREISENYAKSQKIIEKFFCPCLKVQPKPKYIRFSPISPARALTLVSNASKALSQNF
jgi:hypothetical protein